MRARVGTIISRNHAPAARVLARSVGRYHPELRVEVLVVDDEFYPGQLSGEPFDVLTPEGIGIDARELHELGAIYNGLELCEALKPRLLRHLVSDADAAVYVDSDVEFFARIDDLFELASSHAALLTPHVIEPLTPDDLVPDEHDVIRTGVYNAGFIGVGDTAAPFLDWWRQRLERHCLHDAHLFGDQLWLNLAPVFFDCVVTRDAGCNVASWNLGPRTISRDSTGTYTVNGVPLRFFHYAAFDPYTPHLLHLWDPKYPWRSRIASDHPHVAALCQRYAAALMAHGYDDESRLPYGFERTPTGFRIDVRARRLYREALMGGMEASAIETRPHPARANGPLPDPFSPTEANGFLEWLRAPGSGPAGLPQYLQLVYDERPDVQAIFGEVEDAGDSRRFMTWVRIYGGVEEEIPPELIPER
jgi:hypothetical protein